MFYKATNLNRITRLVGPLQCLLHHQQNRRQDSSSNAVIFGIAAAGAFALKQQNTQCAENELGREQLPSSLINSPLKTAKQTTQLEAVNAARDGQPPKQVTGVAVEFPNVKRRYGRIQSTSWTREALWKEKLNGEEQTQEVLKQLQINTLKILQIIKDCEGKQAEFNKTQPEHVRKLHAGKQSVAMYKLWELAQDPETKRPPEDNLLENMQVGMLTYGPVQQSTKYAAESKENRLDREKFDPPPVGTTYKYPTRPPKHMSPENNSRLMDEFLTDAGLKGKEIDGKYATEIGPDELTGPPIPCFGTEQGEIINGIFAKLRRIAN